MSQSADDFLSGYSGETPVSVPTGTASANDFLSAYSVEPPVGGSKPETPEWGALEQAANGLLLGAGPYITAAGRTVRGIKDFSSNLADVKGAQEAYEEAHPLLAPALSIGGSIPTVGLATAALPALQAPAVLGKAGLLAERIANTGLAGATAGALQTPLTGGDIGENALTGAGLGGGLALAGAGGKALLRPVVDNGVAVAASAAEALGVRLRAGQMAPGLKRADTMLAGAGNTQQLRDFTRAASRTIGKDTDSLTPDVHQQALEDIGNGLDQAATQVKVNYDQTLHQDLSQVMYDVTSSPGLSKADKDAVRGVIEDIRDNSMHNQGTITGKAYQAITQSGSLLQRLADNDSGIVRHAGGEISDKLFDALQRATPPDQVDNLIALKNQYRAAMQLRPAVKAAGPSGLLDPKKLAGKAQSGDLQTLGDVGRLLPSPDSLGQAKSVSSHLPLAAKLALGGAGIGAGEELAGLLHDPHALAAATALGVTALGAKRLGRGVMESDFLRNLALGQPAVNPLVGQAVVPTAVGAVNSGR